MHPNRPPSSPALPRPNLSPPSRTLHPPPTPPPPSLPPIHQLYLPHPHPIPPTHSSYPYHSYPSSHPPPPPREPEHYVTADSEADDIEHHGPPKKKRRRQALSCTECKRRKIKCDRSQPCAPCTRRGEQAKCQWHVVEPIEKYVTRAEYDELKARFDHLSALVDRLLGHIQTPATALGGSSEAVSTYAVGVSPYHHPLMPPPQNYPQPHIPPESSAAQAPQTHRYSKGEEPVTRRPGSSHSVGVSGSSPAAAAAAAGLSPILSSTRPTATVTMNKSPPTSTASVPKSSPLSLAAITSPFTPPDHAAQSKNCHAQTFILGERLRPGPQDRGDPVTRLPIPPPRPQHITIQRKPIITIGTLPSISIRLPPASAGSAI